MRFIYDSRQKYENQSDNKREKKKKTVQYKENDNQKVYNMTI